MSDGIHRKHTSIQNNPQPFSRGKRQYLARYNLRSQKHDWPILVHFEWTYKLIIWQYTWGKKLELDATILQSMLYNDSQKHCRAKDTDPSTAHFCKRLPWTKASPLGRRFAIQLPTPCCQCKRWRRGKSSASTDTRPACFWVPPLQRVRRWSVNVPHRPKWPVSRTVRIAAQPPLQHPSQPTATAPPTSLSATRKRETSWPRSVTWRRDCVGASWIMDRRRAPNGTLVFCLRPVLMSLARFRRKSWQRTRQSYYNSDKNDCFFVLKNLINSTRDFYVELSWLTFPTQFPVVLHIHFQPRSQRRHVYWCSCNAPATLSWILLRQYLRINSLAYCSQISVGMPYKLCNVE